MITRRIFFIIPLIVISLVSKAQTSEAFLTDDLIKKPGNFFHFASDKTSEEGSYDVYKINAGYTYSGAIVIKGNFQISDHAEKKQAKITVFNAANDLLVGIYNTNPTTGKYIVILVPNVRYNFQVEVPGFETYRQMVEVPLKIDYEVCKQNIELKKNETGKTIMSINNWFAEDSDVFSLLVMYNDSIGLQSTQHLYKSFIIKNTDEPDKEQKVFSDVDDMVKDQVEQEQKKPIEAKAAFQKKKYKEAEILYGQLLQNDPDDPFLNYYYGVCLYYSNAKKTRVIYYLKTASRAAGIPYDVFYYLANSYRLSYMFNEAINEFEVYKNRSKPEEFAKYHIAELIRNCKNGSKLMSNQINILIESRTPIDNDSLLAYYNSEFINDKLMYKTDFFTSPVDKKKKEKLLMYKNKREIISVSYGLTGENGKDLYSIAFLNNKYGSNQNLGQLINTPADEDYPYMTDNGKTLYFSSKGHNSMGGYDIFKSTRQDTTGPWSPPVNVGYPINSPYDDILFIPDLTGEFASFCTNKKFEDKFELLQIKIPKKKSSVSIIKGHFESIDSLDSRDAIISIYNKENDEIKEAYKTNPLTGDYLMALFSDATYIMVVESEGYPEFTAEFTLPPQTGDFILKQELWLKGEGANKSLKVNNFFTEAGASQAPDDYPLSKQKSPVKVEKSVKEFAKNGKPQRTPEQRTKDSEALQHAIKFFEAEKYIEAMNIYKELDAVITLTPLDFYRYGRSLYTTLKDKSSGLKYLEFAIGGKDVPYDIYYYLGKANHACYRFQRAIIAYENFKSAATPNESEKLNIDQEISLCINGKKFVSNTKPLEAVEKKSLKQEIVYMAFNDLKSGAKILFTPEDLKSELDKKKNFKSTLFLSPDKNTIYYSSYGDNGLNGKDIYKLTKLANGSWSLPENIITVNTSFDEEFPFLSSNGQTLYFSSKGHNSMGIYDIFKCTWNEEALIWSQPVNMGIPVNSPSNDIYYTE